MGIDDLCIRQAFYVRDDAIKYMGTMQVQLEKNKFDLLCFFLKLYSLLAIFHLPFSSHLCMVCRHCIYIRNSEYPLVTMAEEVLLHSIHVGEQPMVRISLRIFPANRTTATLDLHSTTFAPFI